MTVQSTILTGFIFFNVCVLGYSTRVSRCRALWTKSILLHIIVDVVVPSHAHTF